MIWCNSKLNTHLRSFDGDLICCTFQKCIMKLKLDQAPTVYKLSIYKLAQQAIDMSHDHPVAILTWQKFFICYLGRSSTRTR